MAKAESTTARAPRGSKSVMQAFFTALDALPKMQQGAVMKAALTMIRDESKTRRTKATTAAAKERARAPAKTLAKPRLASRKPADKVPAAVKPGRGGRKPVAETES